MLTLSLLIGCFKVGDSPNIQNINPQKAEKYINKCLNEKTWSEKESRVFPEESFWEALHGNLTEVRMAKSSNLLYSEGAERTVIFLHLNNWTNLQLQLYLKTIRFLLNVMNDRQLGPLVQIDRIIFIGGPSNYNVLCETSLLAIFVRDLCRTMKDSGDTTPNALPSARFPRIRLQATLILTDEL